MSQVTIEIDQEYDGYEPVAFRTPRDDDYFVAPGGAVVQASEVRNEWWATWWATGPLLILRKLPPPYPEWLREHYRGCWLYTPAVGDWNISNWPPIERCGGWYVSRADSGNIPVRLLAALHGQTFEPPPTSLKCVQIV